VTVIGTGFAPHPDPRLRSSRRDPLGDLPVGPRGGERTPPRERDRPRPERPGRDRPARVGDRQRSSLEIRDEDIDVPPFLR
jgi:hypothetical protein